MSSSYVEYREKGFWSWDGYLEEALLLLAEAIDVDSSPSWLVTARAHWIEHAPIWGGCISPDLDEFLQSDEQRTVFLETAGSILVRSDVPAEARQTVAMFMSLVRGEIKTDESSPLDYMVGWKNSIQNRE